ncbi:protein YgfX [Pseudoalteromonas sp. T1lg10]|uniref:protein YgfX n=1 Tax=Pseudoalteromonas sp. T1lg10 TaxID=2077093 RepID=UPI00131A0B30|nr:protein YgfX [Pseudoalteromonas sp. T1lg10]
MSNVRTLSWRVWLRSSSTASVYSGAFSNNIPQHRPVMAVFVFVYALFLLAHPQWLWALCSALILALGYCHFWFRFRRCWPHQGKLLIQGQRAEVHQANASVSGRLLAQSRVYPGLIHLQLQDDMGGKRHHIFIAARAMTPEHFRECARAVQLALSQPQV